MNIDERVVEMRFRNGQFERGISATSKSLARFKKDLDMQGAAKGLDGLGRAGKNVDLSHIGDSVDKINNKFSLLSVVGATAIAKLTSSAIDMGKRLISAVWDPIVQGGERRAQNIEQAKFMLNGLKIAWRDIEPAISHAVDGTAYGLDEAAKAASTLAASNVPLDRMADSLRGISGVAAMTNSGFTDIAQIFTTIAGNGRVMASEMNRIGQRGINAWAPLAEHIGVTEQAVRQMVSEGKVDFQTFADAMNNAFGEQATKANETYSGSLSNIRAALARIGQAPAEGKFERLRLIFNALRPRINEVKDALEPLLNLMKNTQIRSGERLAAFFDGLDLSWTRAFFAHVSTGIQNIQDTIMLFGRAASKAWKLAFPEGNGGMDWLVGLARGFKNLTESLKPSKKQLELFTQVLTTVFSIARTVGTVLGGVWDIFKAGLAVVGEIVGIFVDFIKSLFDAGDETSTFGENVSDFLSIFEGGFQDAVSKIVEWLGRFRDAIAELRAGGSSGVPFIDYLYESINNFNRLASGKVWEFFTNIGDAIQNISAGNIITGIRDFVSSLGGIEGLKVPLSGISDWTKNFFSDFKSTFSSFWEFIKPIGQGIGDVLVQIAEHVGNFISSITLEDVLEVANLGMLLVIIVQIKKVLDSFIGMGDSLGGMFSSIGEFFGKGGVIDTHLKEIRNSMKVDSFLKIAVAIGLLAGALWLLSTIPTDKLISAGIALGAIAIGFLALSWGLKKLTENMKPEHAEAMKSVSTAMLLMSISIGFLAAAVWLLGQMEFEEIAQGVGAIVILMGTLIATAWVLTKNTKGMVAAAFAVNIFAGALFALAAAVWLFGVMDRDTLIQGGIAVGVALAALSAAMWLMGRSEFIGQTMKAAIGIGLIILSLYALAGILWIFAQMEWSTIQKGAIVAGTALLFMTGMLMLLEKFAPGAMNSATAIAILAASLIGIAIAMTIMDKIHPGKAILNAVLMIALIGALGVVAIMIDRLNAVDGATGVAILAGALIGVSIAMTIMDRIHPGKAILNAVLMIALIGALGLVAVLIDKIDAKDGAVAVAILSGALLGVAAAMTIMDHIHPGKALLNAGLMIALVGALGIIAVLLDQIQAKDGAVAVAILSGSLIGVAAAFWIMDKIDPARMLGNTLALIGVIGGLGIIAGLLDKLDVKWGVVAIAALTGAIWVIAQSLTDLDKVSMDKIWGMVGAILLLVGGLSGIALIVGLIAGKFPLAILAIGALALLIWSVSELMYSFSAVIDSVAGLLEVLIEGFLVFNAEADNFAKALEVVSLAASENSQYMWDLIKVGLGLAAFGIGAGIAGWGAELMGNGLKVLGEGAQSFNEVADEVVEAIVSMVVGLTDLIDHALPMIGVGFALGVLGIGAGAAGIGLWLLAFGAEKYLQYSDVIVEALTLLVEALTNVELVDTLKIGLLGGVLLLLGVGSLFAATGLAALELASRKFLPAVDNIIDGLDKLAKAAGDISQYADDMMLVGAGIFVLGLAAFFAWPGLLLLSGVTKDIGVAMLFMAAVMDRVVPSFENFADSVKNNADAILPMAGLGASLWAFGEGAEVAGNGAMILGAGLVSMGIGLAMIAMSGESGAQGVVSVIENIAPLWVHAVSIGIAADNLSTLGDALKSFGAGAQAASIGGDELYRMVQMLTDVLPTFATNLSDFAGSFEPAAQAASDGIQALGTAISNSAVDISAALAILATAVASGSSGMITAFQSLGTQASQAMGQSIASGLMAIAGLVSASVIMICAQAAAQARGTAPMFISAGQMMGLGMAMGIRQSTAQSMAAVRQILQLLVRTIRSYSPQMRVTAVLLMTGFISGLMSQTSRVQAAGRNVATAFLAGLRSGLANASAIGRSGGYTVGLAIADGAAAGVRAGTGGLLNQVRAMAQSAVKEAKKSLDVRSPSRIFRWIGEMVARGMSVGVERKTGEVVSSTENLGIQAIRSMRGSMAAVNRMMEDTADFNPTITPLLDLTEIERRARDLNNLMAVNPVRATVTANLAQGHASQLTQREALEAEIAATSRGDVNFTQNNYSPKALSTTETYRKGKSLVAKAARVIQEED